MIKQIDYYSIWDSDIERELIVEFLWNDSDDSLKLEFMDTESGRGISIPVDKSFVIEANRQPLDIMHTAVGIGAFELI